ncbi:MAG: nucleoside deaminase [Clostridia bacterium]|jgi:tRNA(adenine34) deaminase|nr:nucleoside deaminase [Clostridia bacterium]MBT7123492.1 nucleoside deaminase [Clostridia bacterium]
MNSNSMYMEIALSEAQKAQAKDEVPVGAVIVQHGKVIAKAFNKRESSLSPIAHAEILAIQKAAKKLKGWRLPGCSLYVTLEPCPMCAGAIINARIDNVYFGAYDSKAGAFGTLYDLSEGKLNHAPSVVGGILEEKCASILTNYFKGKRGRHK